MKKTLSIILTLCFFLVLALPVHAITAYDGYHNQFAVADQTLIGQIQNQSQVMDITNLKQDVLLNANHLSGIELEPRGLQADLQVLRLDVETPNGREPGDLVNLVGVIKNTGNLEIRNLQYAFYVNGQNKGPTKPTSQFALQNDVSVDLGQGRTVIATVLYPGHTRTVRLNGVRLGASQYMNFQLRVDPLNRLLERDENNNARSARFRVSLPPREDVDDSPDSPADDPADTPNDSADNGSGDQNGDQGGDNQNAGDANNGDNGNQNNDPALSQNAGDQGDNNQDNNQDDQPGEQRHSEDDADDELDRANRICRDARDIIDIAKQNLRDRRTVDFDDRDVERADERVDEARTAIRAGREDISNGRFDDAVNEADRAEGLCTRVDRDLDIILPNDDPLPPPQNQQRQQQVQQYQQRAQPPQEPQQDVQLVHNPSLTTPQEPAEPEGIAAWVIASIVVLGGLVAVEVAVLVYYLTR